MECNKDDAIKAMEIAERKFNAKDLAGAKKFALKAQNLYPGLEGIAQMLVTLDVYVSSENQVAGEVDWYGVLGLSPQADEDAVRKQYRKLALILHPDKNKSIGAEGAFKFLSQAWSILSDKSRRAAYDTKRNARAHPLFEGSPHHMFFAKNTTSNTKLNKNTSVPGSNGSSTSGSTDKSNSNTFWTICHRCRMQYEYLRTYLNQNLLCPSCRLPFFAIEQPPPKSKSATSSKPWNSGQHSHQDSRTKSKLKDDFQWVPFSGNAGVSSVARAANVVQQTYEKVRRVREEAQAAKKREKAMKRKNYFSENMFDGSSIEKKQCLGNDFGMNNHLMGHKTAGIGITNSLQTSSMSMLNSSGVLPQIALHNILMDKARKEINKKLDGCKSANETVNTTERGYGQDKRNGTTTINSALHYFQSMKVQNSVPVPAPDFHDFDQYRTERNFEEGQVWAIYDNADGMPRYYAMINRVISRDPFRVCISSLHLEINTELQQINWLGCGFTQNCGDYRVGGSETFDGPDCFSHKVRCKEGSSGTFRIFPSKGDVWALYRNWSRDWDEFTGEEIIHKYDMVEVLEDYDEDLGVVVIPLVKVAGFKALFHQHLDPEQVRRVPKEEIFRFSHQVPSHLLLGQEAPNAPKGCQELDPAALPSDFLQVIGDVTEEVAVNKAAKKVPYPALYISFMPKHEDFNKIAEFDTWTQTHPCNRF